MQVDLNSVLVGISLALSLAAFLLCNWFFIQLEAMKRSTHQLQFVNPSMDEFVPLTESEKEVLTKEPFQNIE